MQQEDAMYRRNVTVSPLARACQTGALLLILFGVIGLLAHSIAVDNRSGLVAASGKHDVR
jgi:hypothetical protein